MILYDGYQIYYGPIAEAVAYFVNMGFVKPPRATSADFLTSVTNPSERRVRDGFLNSVPQSAKDFSVAWKQSDMARIILDQISRVEGVVDMIGQQPMSRNSQSVCFFTHLIQLIIETDLTRVY